MSTYRISQLVELSAVPATTLLLTPGTLVLSVRAPEAAEPLVTELLGVRA